LYFVLFRWFILRFDLQTLGRERDDGGVIAGEAGAGGSEATLQWIRGLGGAINLRAVEACTTRLRLTVADPSRINEAAIKALGSRGVLKLGDGAVQVVVGPIADQLAAEIRAALRDGLGASASPAPATPVPAIPAPATAPAMEPAVLAQGDVGKLLVALGGRDNLARVMAVSSRLIVEARDSTRVDVPGIETAGFRGATRVTGDTWHVIVGPGANEIAAQLGFP
jgi:PTS system N-acetylglucosamine-specific IIC component